MTIGECILPSHHYFDKDGYPRVKYNNRMYRLNRLMWKLSFGEVPIGQVVAHRCNNKGCVNPQHFYLTSAQANSSDAARDGLYRVGNRHPKMKRSDEDCLEIYERYNAGETQQKIAESYLTSQPRIREALQRANELLKQGPNDK